MRLAAALAVTATLAAAALAAGCEPAGIDLVDRDEIYAVPGEHGVTCAASVEWEHVDEVTIEAALDRAVADHTVVQLFAHDPGRTMSIDKLDRVLTLADARHLRYVTYRELAAGTAREREAGLAFSFDDFYVDDWVAIRALLARHHAVVTFFVAGYDVMTADERAGLAELAADGHDLEYHTTRHLHAPFYVRDHGMQAYLDHEIAPALRAMRADGYDPIVFAYPMGHRTDALDAELGRHFALLRSVLHECPRRDGRPLDKVPDAPELAPPGDDLE